MPIPQDDIRAIEAATDILTTGMRRLDISSLADLVTDTTVLMPPERRSAKGRAILDRWRNMAQGTEGFKLLSNDMQALGEGHVCDIGNLSFRRKPGGDQALFRYVIVWRKKAKDWKLAAMMWNRETGDQPGARGGRGGSAAEETGARAPASGAYAAGSSVDGFGDM